MVLTAQAETLTGTTDPSPAALKLLKSVLDSSSGVVDVVMNSSKFWLEFWQVASVSLPSQPVIESMMYGAQYILACTSATSNASPGPGLYGVWATSDNPGVGLQF